MTRDDLIRMAKKAGLELIHGNFMTEAQEKFAALVAAAEREACAVVCEELELPDWPEKVRQPLAAAIRARNGS